MTPDEREPARDEALDAVRAAYATPRQDSRAGLWDRSNRGFDRLARQRDAALLELIVHGARGRERSRLLDVGCGTGDLAVLVRDAGLAVTYVGIDLLADRIANARRRSPLDTFVEGSADRMPFDRESFDVAACVTLFSSLPTPALEEAVAGEIARVLRPGGVIVWYDIRYDNPSNRAVHGVGRRRLAELFPGWPTDLRTLTLLPPIARRLGALTPIGYPALHALPILRSHLVGTAQRPG